jgi:phage repressor protein C with HTH and peptisase S24 domain
MKIQDAWRSRFKEVVQQEIDAAGGRASDGYRAVATKTGLGYDYIYQIFTGKPVHKPKLPGVDTMQAIERVYSKESDSVKNHEPSSHHIPSQAASASADIVSIPQWDTGGKMGSSGLALDGEQPGLIQAWQVSHEWVTKNVREYSAIKNLCIVTGFGNSMQPMFNPGDPLLVDAGVKTVDRDGPYFFRVGGDGYIKTLQRIPGEGLVVLSENPKYKEWTIKPDMDFEVLGRVVRAWCGQDF